MLITRRQTAAGSGRKRQGTTAWRAAAAICRSLPLLAVAACAPSSTDTTQMDTTQLPDSSYTQAALLGHTMMLPTGFTIGVYAQGLSGVRLMVLGPEGDVYASRPGAGVVVRLSDANHDGIADGTTTVRSGLNRPHGLAFRGDTLYVAEENRVVRFVPGAAALEVVVPGIPSGGHSTRTIVFRGDTLYLSVGSSCNICSEGDRRRAAVTAYRADGSGEEIFAEGLRNSVGLAVQPETGEIWATNNDRDHLGDDLPPDRVNILQRGGFYGWPQCYLPGKPNPEFASDQSRCANAIGPTVGLPAHTAPLGLAFYNGTAFPAAYRGALFVAEHGSWNRSTPIGYQVVWIPMQGGKASGPPRPFVSGWLVGSSSWGRPVDVLPLRDGSLLISDDAGGRIYRVTYSG